MKKVLFIALLATFQFAATAQDTAKTDAKLTAATVYYGYGAELTHETKVNVNAGIKQILIRQLSTTVDVNSLQISVPENVMLLSQKYAVYYPPAPAFTINPQVKIFQDSIAAINIKLRRNSNLISIEEQTLEKTGTLIEAVINNSGNKTVSAEDALKYDLITFVTKKQEIAQSVNEFALDLCNNASANALMVTKQLINETTNSSLEKTLDMAVQINARVRESDDFKRGVASFLNKENVNW